MQGIYTTSVSRETLDESPMAYKPMDVILSQIEPTVEVLERLKPVYNFKAGENVNKVESGVRFPHNMLDEKKTPRVGDLDT